ncbi:Sister chromatid cohesion protein 2 [Gamsiella multidivaricata]|nr:Sister chromatid cohesion protein 2 [Gamsiella multidivaricata]
MDATGPFPGARTTPLIHATSSTPQSIVAPVTGNDLASHFEDSATGFLQCVANQISDQGSDLHITLSSELKQLGRAVEELAKYGRAQDVQVDIMSALLKHLDTSLRSFDTVDVLSACGLGLTATEQDGGEQINKIIDHIMHRLNYVKVALVMMSTESIQRHLFPEELLITSLNVIKSQLETFLAPALEFSRDDSRPTGCFALFTAIAADASLKVRMLSLVSSTCEISEWLRRSCCMEVSDGVLVKLVYTALSLFFIDTSSDLVLGSAETEPLRQAGSSLLQMVFAKHTNQRLWILEEILSLLIKLPHGKKNSKGYRLVDGSKIYSSSALLMQLVQACVDSRLNPAAVLSFPELHPSTQRIEMKKMLDRLQAALDDAKSSVVYIFNYLLTRCTKGTKSSVEADYRTILDGLLTDLLAVVGQPEWPSAELYLSVFSKAMARYLDDAKANSVSKTMAVDSFGLIAAKIKTVMRHIAMDDADDCNAHSSRDDHPFYAELGVETKLTDLSYLQARYNSVLEYLSSKESNDHAIRAAKRFWICQWTTAICSATTQDLQEHDWEKNCWKFLTDEAFRCWSLYNNSERQHRSKTPMARKAVCWSSSYLVARQQLFLSFDMLLSRILVALDGAAVSLRAKSLKALSLIVTGDCAVLAQHNVSRTIALRLQDQSPSVRDAATDLVGKYMLQDRVIRKLYYDIVSDRISDTGLNVRKRVLRLLRDMYSMADSQSIRIDISQKLLLRVSDEEATVKDLAIKCVNDVWFRQFFRSTELAKVDSFEASEATAIFGTIAPSQKREVSKHTRTLVDMVSQLPTPLYDAFTSVVQHLLKKERGHGSFDLSLPGQEFTRSCVIIVECLVDLIQTLQDEDSHKSAVISTAHTLHTFVRCEPRLISAKNLGALLVYLHSATTSEDWEVTMFVLRVYQDAIPVVHDMPIAESETAEKLTLALIAKCPVILLPEAALHIMDRIFGDADSELQAELLQIYTQFLVKIHSAPTPGPDQDLFYSLIAKAEDHLGAGVGSAIMQRYLDRVLRCALADNERLQAAAVNVISQVTLQALVHPILCMPAIIALETSEDTLLSGRVLKTHRELHHKHASLIYTRSLECVRTMYLYQMRVQEARGEVQGFRINPETGNAVALLNVMYSLVEDKRQTRNTLLSGLVKVLDVDLTTSDIEVDGNYARFIAENLAYLEYRTTEEIYLVIFYINRIIAGAGVTILESLTATSPDSAQSCGDKASRVASSRLRRLCKTPVESTMSSAGNNTRKTKRATQPNAIAAGGSSDEGADGMQSGEDALPCGQGNGEGGGYEPSLPTSVLAKASVAVETAILLKSYFKRIYDITETKSQHFQPTAHASHKEKPSPRFKGILARLQWPWKAKEADAICGQKNVTVGESIRQDLIRSQLVRFRGLMEAETVQQLPNMEENEIPLVQISRPSGVHVHKPDPLYDEADEYDGVED